MEEHDHESECVSNAGRSITKLKAKVRDLETFLEHLKVKKALAQERSDSHERDALIRECALWSLMCRTNGLEFVPVNGFALDHALEELAKHTNKKLRAMIHDLQYQLVERDRAIDIFGEDE